MSNVEIKFTTSGLPSVKAETKSVVELSKQANLAIQHAQERHNQRMKELRHNLSKIENDANQSDIKARKATLDRMAKEEERFSLKTKQMRERAGLKVGGDSSSGGVNLSAIGHIAQVGGFYRAGHALRAIGELGVGASIALAGLAAVVTPTILVFDGLKDAAESVASSFIGAVAEIGKLKNLQSLIVESVTAQRLAATVSANTTDHYTTDQILQGVNRISKGSEFSPEEIGVAAREFASKTGNFGDFSQMGRFITQLASVEKMPISQAAEIVGQIRTQFPGLSNKQVQEATTNLWGLGRAGTVELKDAQSITQALGLAGKIRDNPIHGMSIEMGLVQLAQKFTGGQTAREAVTGVKNVQLELLKDQKKFSFLGDYLKHNDKGELVFKDIEHTMAQLAYRGYTTGNAGVDARANKSLLGIAGAASSEFTGNREHDIKIIEAMIASFQDGTKVIDEFDGAVKNVEDTVEFKLRAAINSVTVELESGLLDAMKKLTPEIIKFANEIANNKDQIIDDIIILGQTLASVIPPLAVFGLAMIRLAAPLANVAEAPLAAYNKDLENKFISGKTLSDKEIETYNMNKRAIEMFDKLPSTLDKAADAMTKLVVTLSKPGTPKYSSNPKDIDNGWGFDISNKLTILTDTLIDKKTFPDPMPPGTPNTNPSGAPGPGATGSW